MTSQTITHLIMSSMPLLLQGALMTLKIAFFAIIISITLGLLLGICTAQKTKILVLSQIINIYVLIIRGTPVYIQVLIVYYALPDIIGINLSPFIAGVITLGGNSTAYVCEIIRGVINTIDNGQWNACYVLGYNKLQTLVYIILPQTLKNTLASLTNELVVITKETSILSTIGLLEITRIGTNINAQTLAPMPIYLIITGLYFSMTTAINIISKKIEGSLSYD